MDNQIPTSEDIQDFWAPIYTSNAKHNENAHWLEKITENNLEQMNFGNITEEDVKHATNKTGKLPVETKFKITGGRSLIARTPTWLDTLRRSFANHNKCHHSLPKQQCISFQKSLTI